MNNQLIPIGEVAQKLHVTITTLRRWDKSGRLKSIRPNPRGRRFYNSNTINLLLQDSSAVAQQWVAGQNPGEIDRNYHCPDSQAFQSRLNQLEKEIQTVKGLEKDFSLITSIAGEIGNNSFDHNIGSWPDIRGIFFVYDLNKRQIVLADRGQGILQTLRRVRPEIKDDQEALMIAFTEKVSGRAPESRGNGLKYVRKVVTGVSQSIKIRLHFQSGRAILNLKPGDSDLAITVSDSPINGCLALIKF